MSYIIGNKRYSNKRKWALLFKRTRYRLQSTAAKKQKRRKVSNKITELKKIYLKIENSKSSFMKRGTYKNV